MKYWNSMADGRSMLRTIKILILFILGVQSFSGFATESSTSDLNSLISEALVNNPELAAARNSWGAAIQGIKGSAAIEPPLAGVEFYQVPTRNFPSLKDNQETDYFIQQMIPFPGKLYENKKSAQNSALMSEHDYNAAVRRVIADLKMAYYGLYFAQQKAAVNGENQK